MKAINIYALTRLEKQSNIKRLERQMSKRTSFLPIKSWEIECTRKLSKHLCDVLEDGALLEFYYSFQIPKIGKEFDLLRISDDYVINIELKSGDVSDEKIKSQLVKNRYYLAMLGKNMRSYTYISNEDRLVRLTNGGRLIEETWDKLAEDIIKQGECYKGDIEEFFREENYLISPLTDPQRFLRREYSLTSQQWDIRRHILGKAELGKTSFQGFTGLPGTGKTLLLYDIAMQLSDRQKVAILHFGSFPDELAILDNRLKRIDFFPCRRVEIMPDLSKYAAIFVDEGHRIDTDKFQWIVEYATDNKLPVIISYDSEDAISPLERKRNLPALLDNIPGFIKYRLTNRIRMNVEISSFINCVMNTTKYNRRKAYPSVEISYANNEDEKIKLINYYKKKGYMYIKDDGSDKKSDDASYEMELSKATCREFDKVLIVVNDSYEYDDDGYLRTKSGSDDNSRVRHLFHAMNRAKLGLGIIVIYNKEVFENMLSIIQGQ